MVHRVRFTLIHIMMWNWANAAWHILFHCLTEVSLKHVVFKQKKPQNINLGIDGNCFKDDALCKTNGYWYLSRFVYYLHICIVNSKEQGPLFPSVWNLSIPQRAQGLKYYYMRLMPDIYRWTSRVFWNSTQNLATGLCSSADQK